MITRAPLTLGALVWFLQPPSPLSRHGRVIALDGELVQVEHGTERVAKQQTWHNRDQLATPIEWGQILSERRRERESRRRRRR